MKNEYHKLLDSVLDSIIEKEIESKNPDSKTTTIFQHEHHGLAIEKLLKDGFVKHINNTIYQATIEGRLFYENGGYAHQHYLAKRQLKAKWFSDYFDILIKPLTVVSLIVGVIWVSIQIIYKLCIHCH